MKEKQCYVSPQIEVKKFEIEDVIMLSGPDLGGTDTGGDAGGDIWD